MAERYPLIKSTPQLSEDEKTEFLSYPGDFCCGDCPKVVQCPWRFLQCWAGTSCLCCCYLPQLLIMWLVSCFHGCFCNCCCPVIAEEPARQYTGANETPRCLSSHSRRFFGCCTLKLINVSPAKRWICWRCCYHYTCCMATVDLLLNTRFASKESYIQEMRNAFGEYVPIYGTVAICDYDEGIELCVGKDVYRTYGFLLSQPLNSVVNQQNDLRANGLGNEPPQAELFEARRNFQHVIYGEAWDRVRVLFHGDSDGASGVGSREQIEADLRSVTEKFDNPTDSVTATKVSMFMLWYLLTGGKLNDAELDALGSAGVSAFVDNWTHFLIGGYFLLYRVADAADSLNKALLRRPDYYKKVVAHARQEGWDVPSVMRLIVGMVFTGGGPGMALALRGVIQLIEKDPAKYLALYEADPMAFVEEYLRTEPAVAETTLLSSIDREFVSGGHNITLYKGDKICSSLIGMSTNANFWGSTDVSFNPDNVVDPDRRAKLKNFPGFMGRLGDFQLTAPMDAPPRGCPGMFLTLQCVLIYIESYKGKYQS